MNNDNYELAVKIQKYTWMGGGNRYYYPSSGYTDEGEITSIKDVEKWMNKYPYTTSAPSVPLKTKKAARGEFHKLLNQFSGPISELPEYIEKNRTSGHGIWAPKLVLTTKCKVCNLLLRNQDTEYHEFTDKHVQAAFEKKHEAVEFRKGQKYWSAIKKHRHWDEKLVLCSMGLIEQVRGVWYIKKATEIALDAKQNVAPDMDMKEYLGNLGPELKLPQVLG